MAPPTRLPIRSSSSSTWPSSPSPMYPAGAQRPFTACSVPDPLSSIPSSSTLTTQTREAIRRGLRVRHSDDRIRTSRGMSNNIRMATVTDDEAAARNSLAHFVFSSPPSCAGSGNMLLRSYTPYPLLSHHRSYAFPLYTSYIFTGRPRKPVSLPLSLIGYYPRYLYSPSHTHPFYQWTRSNYLDSNRSVRKSQFPVLKLEEINFLLCHATTTSPRPTRLQLNFVYSCIYMGMNDSDI